MNPQNRSTAFGMSVLPRGWNHWLWFGGGTSKLIILFECLSLVLSEAQESDIFEAIAHRDQAGVGQMIREGIDPNTRKNDGTTLLMQAALHGNAAILKILLEAGAKPNVSNDVGVTALHWCAGDFEKVKLLLKAGADPKVQTRRGNTPLSSAAAHPDGYDASKLLVEHGASIQSFNKRGFSTLGVAVFSGSEKTIQFLLKKGAEPNHSYGPASAPSILSVAAERRNEDVVRLLIEHRVNPNQTDQFTGHALNRALLSTRPEIARMLIKAGADVRKPTTLGDDPPIQLAAYNEVGDVSMVQHLMTHGISVEDLDISNQLGETALTWAKRRQHQQLIDVLFESGARKGLDRDKQKIIPNKKVKLTASNRDPILSKSIHQSLRLLQNASDVFLKNRGFCVSCHHQYIPEIALGWAKDKGFPIDEASLERSVSAHVKEWKSVVEPVYQMENRFIFNERIFGWGLLGLKALDYPADEITRASVWYLAASQRPDGSWIPGVQRPPLGGGRFMTTVLSMAALKMYPIPGRETEFEQRMHQAKTWLQGTVPQTFQEKVLKLAGLCIAGEDKGALQALVETILRKQKEDGGWAQLPGLPSDAWMTGLTLVVLEFFGLIDTSDEIYQAGLEFLLSTEFEDGSWFVQRRAWPMQPLFDSQFPHGKDQWISAAATTFATMAMLRAVESYDTTLINASGRDDPLKTTDALPNDLVTSSLRFDADIKPILEKSCTGCHEGKSPKARLRLNTLESLRAGGESGVSTVVPGEPLKSPLYRFPAGLVEDMEMPPLHKRNDYPALTESELEQIRLWILSGAQ